MTDLDLTPRPPVAIHAGMPAGVKAMYALSAAIDNSPLSHTIQELVKIRASQINGCAFCLEMHHHDAREQGESIDRLALLSTWRESELYTHEERVALAVTEAVTLIADDHLPAALEAEARSTFDEATYAALIYAIVTINAWNRFAIVGHSVPGSMRK